MKNAIILALSLFLTACGSETYVERTHTEPVYVNPEPSVIVHRYQEPRAHVYIHGGVEP